MHLSLAASYPGDPENALAWARQAQRIDPATIPGWVARLGDAFLAGLLIEAGEVASAQRRCAAGLARARVRLAVRHHSSIGSRHLVHTEEVTGSIPVSPTIGCRPVASRLSSGSTDLR
jgi:hypothetical protein